jgi:glucose repression regulatory protein TUP1
VDLEGTLPHPSVVCGVRFSSDGLLLATGANHEATVYDVETLEAVVTFTLQGKLRPDGGRDDLYIRSVCFSPDGTYLAAGGEDRGVHVRSLSRL